MLGTDMPPVLLCTRCRRPLPPGATACPACRPQPLPQRPKPAGAGSARFPVQAAPPSTGTPTGTPPTGAARTPATGTPATGTPATGTPATGTPAAREVAAWLVCRYFPPYPLGAGSEVVIGRGDECGIVLSHAGVSRRHAIVRAGPTGLEALDPGSANGTWVNGRRVGPQPMPLGMGDALEIGPFRIKVSPSTRPARDPNRLSMADTAEVIRPPDSELSGRLGKVGLAEIFQVIELFEKTGTLTVTSREAQGELVVLKGKPASARCGDEVDRQAVQSMLRIHMGTFEFTSSVDEQIKTTMEGTTLSGLLLEFARADDEFRRSRQRVVEEEASSFFDLNAVFAQAKPPAGFGGEKTQVLARQVPCPSCNELVDGMLVACQRCGAPLRMDDI